MEVVTDFLFLGSKVTVDVDCSRVIRRCLLLGRKALTNLDIVLKSRDNTLLTEGPYIQGSGLPVVTCGYENWTVMKVWGAKESMPLNCGAGEDS